MEKAQLDEILQKNKMWLNDENGGERVDLRGVDLEGADLGGAKNVPFIPIACPSHGEFIAWKKVDNYIIKLLIPADAKRSSATTEKCRCDKAVCLAIENIDGTQAKITKIVNSNYYECVYEIGKDVKPDSFDDNRWNECSHGIHFFVDRQSAVEW